MVPTDYRLDRVTARLIERLEGARRTFADREGEARLHFEEAADRHVTAAIEEYRALAMEEPGPHAEFLTREVRRTALPRYHRLAMDMNRIEAARYGFGWLYEPAGRFVLVIVAAVVAMGLVRFAASPLTWPLLLVDLSLPLWPSISEFLVRQRYQREVQDIVGDMARIQEAERAYLLASERSAGKDPEEAPRPPRTRQPEGP